MLLGPFVTAAKGLRAGFWAGQGDRVWYTWPCEQGTVAQWQSSGLLTRRLWVQVPPVPEFLDFRLVIQIQFGILAYQRRVRSSMVEQRPLCANQRTIKADVRGSSPRGPICLCLFVWFRGGIGRRARRFQTEPQS